MWCYSQQLLACFISQFSKKWNYFLVKLGENSKLWIPAAWKRLPAVAVGAAGRPSHFFMCWVGKCAHSPQTSGESDLPRTARALEQGCHSWEPGSKEAERVGVWAEGRGRVGRGATRSSPSPAVGCTEGLSQVLTREAEMRDSHSTASGVIPDCLLPPSETQGLEFSGWSGKVTDHYLHPN